MAFHGLFGSSNLTRVFKRDMLENQGVDLNSDAVFDTVFGWNGLKSASGEVVNEEAALGVPAVWTAVDFIGSTIASLPLQLFKDDADGIRTKATADPLYSIIHDQANPYMTSTVFRRCMMTQLLTKGRFFAFIERNGGGRPMGLWPKQTDQMKVVERPSKNDPRINERVYVETLANGQTNEFTPDEMLDLAWMLRGDAFSHINPIQQLRNAIGLAIGAEKYASRVYARGGVPPLSLNGPKMSPQAAKRASNDVAAALNAARRDDMDVLVTPDGYTLNNIGFDPMKTQMLDVRKFQVLEVARIYKLPPAFLQDLSTGTFSNTEQQDLTLVKHTLTQWIVLIEQEMNSKLFGDRNRANGFVQFNLDGLLRGDFTTRMTGLQTAVYAAILTPNEARALENREPLPGGDELYIQMATVPLRSQQGYDPNKQPRPTDPANVVTDPDADDQPADDGDDPAPDPAPEPQAPVKKNGKAQLQSK